MKTAVTPKLMRVKPFEVASSSPLLFRLSLDCDRAGKLSRSAGHIREAREKSVYTTPVSLELSEWMELQPVSLCEKEGSFVIIDGHRRMQSAFLTGTADIPALVYPENTPRLSICELALRAAIESKSLSGVEEIIAAYRTCRYMSLPSCRTDIPLQEPDAPGLPSQLHPLFDLLFNRTVSKAFVQRCFRTLSLSMQELEILHALQLLAPHILPLLDLDREERLWLLRQKALFPISAAEMRKIAGLLIVARPRKNSDLENWWEIIRKQGEQVKNGAVLINFLRKELYPELSSREAKIASHLKNLRLPNKIKITPPENLEGNSFSCYFTFSSSKELRSFMDILGRAEAEGKFKAMLEELNPPFPELE
jgi:hypothetical protein